MHRSQMRHFGNFYILTQYWPQRLALGVTTDGFWDNDEKYVVLCISIWPFTVQIGYGRNG